MTSALPTRSRCFAFAVGLGLALATIASQAQPALDGYADYAALSRQVQSFATNSLSTVRSLGATCTGREVWLLSIGEGQRDAKPAILIVGNVEGPRLLGGELALRVAQRLIEKSAGDAAVRQLLARFTFYVIPRPTPDASEAFFRRPGWQRQGNARPIDRDGDGASGEDGPDDLDHNGVITMIRVADPAGDHRPAADDPRLMVKADRVKGQAGTHRLYVEGRDRDGDGQFVEDPPEGVVFNRNFSHSFPYYEPSAGPHAVSEAETRAVVDFAFSRPNIAAVLTFTADDNLLQPWKPDTAAESQRVKSTVLAADAPYYQRIGEAYRKAVGAGDGKSAPPAVKGRGSLSEWIYFQYGRWSLAARAWSIPPATGKPKTDNAELRALQWFAQEKLDGFVAWKPIAHPDFPGKKVEVGGFRPFLRDNPPAALLKPLVEKHLSFLTQFAALLPRLQLVETKVEPLGDGLYRVAATAINVGQLPTASRMGEITRTPHPLQMEIRLPADAALVTGSPRTELPVLAGSGGSAQRRWLVRSKSPGVKRATIRVWAPAVGEAVAAIELKP